MKLTIEPTKELTNIEGTEMSKSCLNCQWFEADKEDGNEGQGQWYAVCRARNGVSNLRQFPFRKTDCPQHRDQSN
jgi:hypothetical protein